MGSYFHFVISFVVVQPYQKIKQRHINHRHNLPSPQRTGTRRRYQDDGISDDEIEGKRTFDLEEKLECGKFGSNLIKHMAGKGEMCIIKLAEIHVI